MEFSPQELVSRFAGAVGTNLDILRQKTMHISGRMTLGRVDIPFQMYSKTPDKFRLEMLMMNQRTISATNGRKSWEISPFEGITEVVEMEESDLDQDRSMFSFGRELIHYARSNMPLNYMGKTKVKGRDTHVLKITKPTEEELLYFIDTQSNLLLLKHNKLTGDQEFYESYKKIEDTLIPHQLERVDRLEEFSCENYL